MTEKPHNDADALLHGIDKTLSDLKATAYEAKKSYDQSDLGRAHRECEQAAHVLTLPSGGQPLTLPW